MFRSLLLIFLANLALRLQAQAFEFAHVADSVYSYTTYQLVDGKPFAGTGLYVVTPAGTALLDAPWDTTQCIPMLDSIARKHGQPVRWCISTHSHADRTGSNAVLRRLGVATYGSAQTHARCRLQGDPAPELTFVGDTTFTWGGIRFETFYPGAGHAPDNIVVWLPAFRVLHGGCLVKSVNSKNLGNLSDADTDHWPLAIRAVMDRFPQAKYVVPGHQGGLSPKALNHTLKLLKQHYRQLHPYR